MVSTLAASSSGILASLPEPIWGPIGREVYGRTYSREKANGSNETWLDTTARVVDGNLKFVDEDFIEAGEREVLLKNIYNFNVLPAGRHLWVTGVPGRQFINNCWNSHWDERFSRHFTFLFERLMEGGGVGANYSNKYLKQYKPFRRSVDLHFVSDPAHKDFDGFNGLISTEYSANWTGATVITDDREGWVAAAETLIDAYHSDGDDPVVIVFDVSTIRPYGSRIKGFGGTASGPKALMEMLRNICDLLNMYRGQKPDSLLCMNLDHLIASCVIAGNVRRSARMSMKYWMDSDIFEFLYCKRVGPDGIARAHWTTNISVVIDDSFFRALKRTDAKQHEHAVNVLTAIAQGMLNNGEPGFYNISKASEGEFGEAFTTNPCGEIAFSSPWEQCNLGHVNLAAFVKAKNGKSVVDESGLYSAMRLMTRFLIRATYSDIPDDAARAVVDKNRRIGVGFFGFQEFVVLQGKRFSECHTDKTIRKILKKCYQVVRKEARDYAFELRIPEPIKVTTVAPTGTIAKMPGTSEGGQNIFAPFFIRRVNFSTTDAYQLAQLQELEAMGYPVEDSVYTPNTKVVSFYVEDPMGAKVVEAGYPIEIVEGQYDVHLQDLLAVQAMIQECYSDNAVSFTANIVKSEYTVNDIIEAIKIYGPRLKGCTVNPDVSDRPQTPYEAITKEQYESFALRSIGQAEIECKNGVCPIK